MTGLRRWRRIAAFLIAVALCVPAHLLWRALGRPSPWPKIFLAMAARAAGARVRIAGQPLHHDVFFIANHLSWIDICALGGTTGCAFIAKGEIGRWPVIGWLAAQNNTILVERERRGALHSQLASLRSALGAHQPVTLFPEGGTGNGRDLMPFKPSLLAVMLPPPRAIMIQPVRIDYGSEAEQIAWSDGESAGGNAARILAMAGTRHVTLHFCAPFDPGDHPDRKEIAARARALIEAARG